MGTITKIYPTTIDFKQPDDIESVFRSSTEITQHISTIIKNYHTINVSEAMQNLAQVGQLLQLAYSGSKGFPCSVNIVGIMSNYQSLIKNSYATSTSFVDISLSALKLHKMALTLFEKKKIDAGMKIIAKTADAAGKMVEFSNDLVNEAKQLCDKSTQALEAATKDESVSTQKKSEVAKLISEYKAKEAKITTMTQGLNTAISEEKEKKEKAAKEAKTDRRLAFTLSLISAAVEPFNNMVLLLKSKDSSESEDNNVDDDSIAETAKHAENCKKAKANLYEFQKNLAVKQKEHSFETDENKKKALEIEIVKLEHDIKSHSGLVVEAESALKKMEDTFLEQAKMAQNKEERIEQRLIDLQKELRHANADLAESVSKLASSHLEVDNLDKAIHSLEVTVQTLGKIKTVFENTRLFWMSVQNQCKKLADVECIKILSEIGDGCLEELLDEVKRSGFNWLALGKINLTAKKSMENVNHTIDQIMTNLPSKEDATSLAHTMLAQLEGEAASLKGEKTIKLK